VSQDNCAIDLTRIQALRELRLSWSAKKYSSLFDCTGLKGLGMDNYSGPDLVPLARLSSLENVGLAFTRLERLVGVEAFLDLKRLSLGPINRLETLEGIQVCRGLSDLEVGKAAKLRSIDAVKPLLSLRVLSLVDCPKISSIDPIRGHFSLEKVGFLHKTRILDGDLSALDTLPSLKHASFTDRRQYNRTNASFPKSYRTPNKLITLFDSQEMI
jgi:hypothetical protein